MKRIILLICGYVMLALGAIGIAIPILPTTPFILVSAICFSISSKTMYEKISKSKIFGDYIMHYRQKTGIRMSVKIYSLILLIVSMTVSAVIAQNFIVTIVLCSVGLIVAMHIILIKTNMEDKKMNLKGTKTEKNLMEAFAGESQARNKYTYFAGVAKKEGYEQIAQIFENTANNEKEHAKLWFKALGELGTTTENLVKAAAGEHGEWTDMYKRMAEDAKAEGFKELAEQLLGVAKIEEEHEKRYLALAENIKNNKVFARKEKTVWECRNCGYLVTGEKAPDKCPICNHAQAHFEIRKENY